VQIRKDVTKQNHNKTTVQQDVLVTPQEQEINIYLLTVGIKTSPLLGEIIDECCWKSTTWQIITNPLRGKTRTCSNATARGTKSHHRTFKRLKL
jgi:hypothetical protein